MRALYDRFGQPHQLALKKIANVLEAPEIRRGDSVAFQRFSLQIQSLVGLLKTLGPEGEIELNCGSHVARLMTKLQAEQRADFRHHRLKQPGTSHTLHNLSEWLSYESWCMSFDSQISATRGALTLGPRPRARAHLHTKSGTVWLVWARHPYSSTEQALGHGTLGRGVPWPKYRC